MVSTGVPALNELMRDGYPGKAAILISGPPGIGKEALGYLFAKAGIMQGDMGLYITRLAAAEVLQDMQAFNVGGMGSLVWISKTGGEFKCDLNDLPGLSYSIKAALRKNGGTRVRVVIDILSSMLMLNSPETVYRFVSQLLDDIKQYDAVVMAPIDEGMHSPQVVAAMAQLFDGVLEVRLYEEGLRLVLLLGVAKMRGLEPRPAYYDLSFDSGRIVINQHAK